MTLEEYVKKNGLKVKYVCAKANISAETYQKLKNGGSVTSEICERIKSNINTELQIKICKGHVRKRTKKD